MVAVVVVVGVEVAVAVVVVVAVVGEVVVAVGVAVVVAVAVAGGVAMMLNVSFDDLISACEKVCGLSPLTPSREPHILRVKDVAFQVLMAEMGWSRNAAGAALMTSRSSAHRPREISKELYDAVVQELKFIAASRLGRHGGVTSPDGP